jgi:hypothetical protein
MKVVFTRTGERRYKVRVESKGGATVSLDPAPGFHDQLPHDVAHFIVENELGILGGVFGQIALGGSANTFHSDDPKKVKKTRRRGQIIARENKKDALFSEHAVYAAQSRWEKHEIVPRTEIPAAQIDRIIDRFQAFATEWSKLPVGGEIAFEWNVPRKPKRKR